MALVLRPYGDQCPHAKPLSVLAGLVTVQGIIAMFPCRSASDYAMCYPPEEVRVFRPSAERDVTSASQGLSSFRTDGPSR
jgi:hypothetical protein